MADDSKIPRGSAARRIAITGALITGLSGIAMAIYSVLGGEETGGGALLAASALAFGLLAINVERAPRGTQAGEPPARAGPRSEAQPSPAPGSAAVGKAPPDAEPLTQRERQVLSLVAEGFSNKRISADLGISERTVKSHLTGTMTKLRASDRTHAVVTALRLGWIEL